MRSSMTMVASKVKGISLCLTAMPASMRRNGVAITSISFVSPILLDYAAFESDFCYVKVLLDEMKANAEEAIPDVLNTTFHKVDQELSKMAAKEGTHSGCTAVTAFLRLEDASGKPISNQDADKVSSRLSESAEPSAAISNEQAVDDSPDESSDLQQRKRFGDGVHRDKIKDFFRSSSTSNSDSRSASFSTTSSSATQAPAPVYPKYRKEGIKRTLYTANVGDARAVLWYVRYPLSSACTHLTFWSQPWREGSPIDIRS